MMLILTIWLLMFFIDYKRVDDGKKTLFCVEKNDANYYGAGYSYVMYRHPITGKMQYSLAVFGRHVKSTFTN